MMFSKQPTVHIVHCNSNIGSSPQDLNTLTLTGTGDSLRRGVGSLLGNLQKLKLTFGEQNRRGKLGQ